jgi:NAD-dependent deacetylase
MLIGAIADEKGLILALTGAGVSVASGIPTFRGSDAGAIWRRDVREMATIHYFRRSPVSAWQWFRKRFASAVEARPNSAPTALAALERWHIDRGWRFLLVTQNVDSLHEQAGSIHLAKVHGRLLAPAAHAKSARGAPPESVAIADLDLATFDDDPRLKPFLATGCGG